ncbi:TniB protein [Pseudomonas marincola]|nr:TniB protein [Pseudomonas marincola]
MGYEHVIQQRRHLVNAEEAIRVSAIHEDIWVEYPLATKILATVRYMIQMPKKIQAPCLLIHSNPGMGKSTLFHKINTIYGFSSGQANCLASMTIRVSDTVSHKAFATSVVTTLTGGAYKKSAIDDKSLVSAIAMRNIVGIMFDELNDILLSGRLDQAKNMKYLKELSGYPYSLIIIVVGTHACNEALSADKQLLRRFTSFELPPWRDERVLLAFINSYISTFPLRRPSMLGKPSIIKHIIHESNGVLDNIKVLLCHAACWAIIDGREEIDFEMIKKGRDIPAV